MLYAIERGRRRRARPRHRARCPTCRRVVLAKCGEHVIWHWAHQWLGDCDPWKGGETDWHREWKSRFPERCVEVWRAGHRADVLLDDAVIEFQRGGLPAETLRERETHWGRGLIWVVYAHHLRENELNEEFRQEWVEQFGWEPSVDHQLDLRPKSDGSYTFRWKHAMKSWRAARQPVLLDLGDERGLFELTWVGWSPPTGGKGRFVELGWEG